MAEKQQEGGIGGTMVRPDWLAKHTEKAFDPQISIIDPHHHYWDPPGQRYFFDELLADVQTGHNFDATVFVECHSMYRNSGPEEMKPVGETEFIAGVAAQSDSGSYGPTRLCAGIVGSVDLALGDRVEPVLEAHIQAAGGRFRGIRDRVSSHPDKWINARGTPEGVLLQDSTRRAVAAMERKGLTFDIWAFQNQANDIIDICKAFPNMTMIIDHVNGPIGCKPHNREELYAPWAQGIRAIAKMPNAVVKLSGLGMRYLGSELPLKPTPPSSDDLVKEWAPYIDVAIEAFGPNRCMFASNFPVDKATCSSAVLWNTFQKLAKNYSAAEKAAMFHDTAARVYRI